MCLVLYGLSVLSASMSTVWPSSSNCCRALVIVTRVWNRQQICHQVIVFNKLTLLIAHVFGDHPLATEAYPLHEFVEGFAFVGGGLNQLAQFEVGDVLQQEDGPHHPAQFAKREVQLVLATVGGEPAVFDDR